MGDPTRCEWCGTEPIYVDYHDTEWGVPEFDDQALFAKLILDGAQAGLAWITILRKRDGYYRAFHGLDPVAIARYDEGDVGRLMADAGIVRNQAKIRSTIGNARAYLELREDLGSFSDYLWGFVDGKPLVNSWRALADLPAETEISKALGKDLKRRGFRFVGPTIIYAFMQAVGMVNDHVIGCFRYRDLASGREP